MEKKPPEELYDLLSDPDEVRNLAASPALAGIKAQLRGAQQEHARAISDVGFIPEGERLARSTGSSPYDLGHDAAKYPFDRVFATAELASMLEPPALPALQAAMTDPDSTVRYWATLGVVMRGCDAVRCARGEFRRALGDASPYVRLAAAQALGEFGDEQELERARRLLIAHADWSKNDVFVCTVALVGIEALGEKATPLAAAIRLLPSDGAVPDARLKEYPLRVLKTLRTRLQ